MVKNLLFISITLSTVMMLSAQNYVQVAVGTGYAQQAYYNLSDDVVTQIANESWDVAFTTFGFADVGISINESTTSVTGMPAPELILYLAPTNDFLDTIAVDSLTNRLYNDESSWENGALNGVATSSDPFDFGWGSYNVNNHTLNGTRVFVIKLRNDTYKKFIIESFAGGAYNLKYANLDGSDEQMRSIAKADFRDSPVALFSFETGATLPATGDWDLVFCRYVTPLSDGQGGTLDYPVTGVLSAPGVEVAKAINVNPVTVDHTAYVDSFKTELDVIGHDWKSFDFTSGWVIPNDLAYFVKTADGVIWKLVFIDFEGSSTGVSTFEKTEMGVLSSVKNRNSNVVEASVYPNPIIDKATVAFTLKQNQNNLQMRVTDLSGKTVWQTAGLSGNEGLNIFNLPRLNLPKGMYLLSIGTGANLTTLKMMQQ